MRFIASFKDGVTAFVEGVNTCFTYSGLIEGWLSESVGPLISEMIRQGLSSYGQGSGLGSLSSGKTTATTFSPM